MGTRKGQPVNVLIGEELIWVADRVLKGFSIMYYVTKRYYRAFREEFDEDERELLKFFYRRLRKYKTSKTMPDQYQCLCPKRKRLYLRAAKFFEEEVIEDHLTQKEK